MTARPEHAGDLLRQWRQRRRLSQLDLAIAADVSSRHLSFVETGRSRPTSDMILRLAEHLDVPLRDRRRPGLKTLKTLWPNGAWCAPTSYVTRFTGANEPASALDRLIFRPCAPRARRGTYGRGMDDKEILAHIDDLIKTEHTLREQLAAGQLSTTREREQLKAAEEALDQCWDLLRQRRARSEFAENPDEAAARPVGEVEGYMQ